MENRTERNMPEDNSRVEGLYAGADGFLVASDGSAPFPADDSEPAAPAENVEVIQAKAEAARAYGAAADADARARGAMERERALLQQQLQERQQVEPLTDHEKGVKWVVDVIKNLPPGALAANADIQSAQVSAARIEEARTAKSWVESKFPDPVRRGQVMRLLPALHARRASSGYQIDYETAWNQARAEISGVLPVFNLDASPVSSLSRKSNPAEGFGFTADEARIFGAG